eukprot:CAMPEP_0177714630 /NCGR_PEP_ID=MMETSP0484_2-20121128/13556_1 /TAXON_ID=354590 /ORGANISM="Rhodomonas lens, Strain RHODO" /LENGTH=229 /DNA_ID=CAMNT_0019226561 /DNA_START=23 /DNA_END=712 /DNA_ORIENTATION=-
MAGANGVDAPADGSTRSWSIQEENDWLRAVLRLAEAHIKHEKEELKSLNVVFERNKADSDQRYMALEARMRATDKDKQEFELRLYREREQIRALEAALNDIRNRSSRTQEMVQKAYADEQVFLDHVRKLKGTFSVERSRLDQEIGRLRQQLMHERQMREEAVQRESATLSRYRATETSSRQPQIYNAAMSGQPTLASQYQAAQQYQPQFASMAQQQQQQQHPGAQHLYM